MRGVSFLRVVARLKPGVTTLTGAGGDAGIIPKLPRATSGNGRQHLVAVPGRQRRKMPPAICVRLSSHCSRQSVRCCSSRAATSRICCSLAFHGTPARDRIAHGARRVAARNRALIRLRKHAGQRDRRRGRTCLALWVVSVIPKLAGQNLPLEGELKLNSRPHFHTGTLAPHRPGHGNVSGVAKFARRSGRWIEGWRARHDRQPRATAFPPRSGRCASWTFGRASRRRRAAHCQFCPAEPAGSRFPLRTRLDGRDRIAASGIS